MGEEEGNRTVALHTVMVVFDLQRYTLLLLPRKMRERESARDPAVCSMPAFG